jgi:hypothetical protein
MQPRSPDALTDGFSAWVEVTEDNRFCQSKAQTLRSGKQPVARPKQSLAETEQFPASVKPFSAAAEQSYAGVARPFAAHKLFCLANIFSRPMICLCSQQISPALAFLRHPC